MPRLSVRVLKRVSWGKAIILWRIKRDQCLSEQESAMAWPNMKAAMEFLLRSQAELKEAIKLKALPSKLEDAEIELIRHKQDVTEKRLDAMLKGMTEAKLRLAPTLFSK